METKLGAVTVTGARPSQTTEQLELMNTWIEQLESITAALEDKLQPATLPFNPPPESEKGSDMELVPLAHRLRTYNTRLENTTLKLQSLNERIEL